MFHELKTTGRSLAVVLVLSSALALPAGLTGCGKSDKSGDRHTAVRAGTTRSASEVAIPDSPAPEAPPVVADQSPAAAVSEPPREVTYEEAEASYVDGNYAKAVELFRRYTERKAANPWGYYMLGLSAWKAGDLACAEEAFERSLALDSLHVKSCLNLSRVLLDTHRPADALEKIDRVLAIDSRSSVAYRLRGRALRQQGEIDDAIAAYREALALDNEDAWAMNNLALILIESKAFDEALPPLARAVEIDGGVAVFWNNLGMALEGTGRFRAAGEAYQSALDGDPSYFKAAMNLTRVDGVQEEPGLEPADLTGLARVFAEKTRGWTEESILARGTSRTSSEREP